MDASLVVRARQGDEDAFAGLVDAVGGRLHAIAYSILRDRQLAQDATQQTLLVAWRDLRQLHDPGRFEAWACRILVRTCRHEARRASRWVPASIVRPGTEPGRTDDTAIVDVHDQLERGFRRLTVDQRAVVVLCYYLDLPTLQTAEILGIPVGTVSSRLHRALDILRAALEADARPVTPVPLSSSPSGGHARQEATR